MKRTKTQDAPEPRRSGRKKLDPSVKKITIGGKIPPSYMPVLQDIAAECAVKLGEKPNMSLILRLACECLIMRKRPGFLKNIKNANP